MYNAIDLFYNGMDEEVSCYRIPSLVTAPNGDLVAAIDERVPNCNDLRGNRDINIIIRRSNDNGESWSNVERVVDFPLGQSASDPSMIVDNTTGSIFLFYNYMDLENEKDIYFLHYTRSDDNGVTWSKPVDITSSISKPAWHKDFKFITSGRGSQTTSGKLIHTLVNLDHGLHLFASDDHGQNWYLIDTQIEPGDESKVIELPNGTWMINSRVNGSGLRYVHTSDDKGHTWKSTADTNLIDPGCNASILLYSKSEYGEDRNRIIFSNAKNSKERTNLTLRVSSDNGITWSDGKTVYDGSSAYSTMTILQNGDIGILFERDNYTRNSFIRIPGDWIFSDH